MFVSLTVPLLSQNYPASCCDLEGNCYKDTKNPRSRKLDKPKLVSLFSFTTWPVFSYIINLVEVNLEIWMFTRTKSWHDWHTGHFKLRTIWRFSSRPWQVPHIARTVAAEIPESTCLCCAELLHSLPPNQYWSLSQIKNNNMLPIRHYSRSPNFSNAKYLQEMFYICCICPI